MNVKDMYLSHEISKELKDIGFNEKCDYYYRDIEGSEEKLFYRLHPSMNNEEVNKNSNHNMITAVTYDQAIEWFIANHRLNIVSPRYNREDSWLWRVEIMDSPGGKEAKSYSNFSTERREGLRDSIKKAIEIVKSSKTENK